MELFYLGIAVGAVLGYFTKCAAIDAEFASSRRAGQPGGRGREALTKSERRVSGPTAAGEEDQP